MFLFELMFYTFVDKLLQPITSVDIKREVKVEVFGALLR